MSKILIRICLPYHSFNLKLKVKRKDDTKNVRHYSLSLRSKTNFLGVEYTYSGLNFNGKKTEIGANVFNPFFERVFVKETTVDNFLKAPNTVKIRMYKQREEGHYNASKPTTLSKNSRVKKPFTSTLPLSDIFILTDKNRTNLKESLQPAFFEKPNLLMNQRVDKIKYNKMLENSFALVANEQKKTKIENNQFNFKRSTKTIKARWVFYGHLFFRKQKLKTKKKGLLNKYNKAKINKKQFKIKKNLFLTTKQFLFFCYNLNQFFWVKKTVFFTFYLHFNLFSTFFGSYSKTLFKSNTALRTSKMKTLPFNKPITLLYLFNFFAAFQNYFLAKENTLFLKVTRQNFLTNKNIKPTHNSLWVNLHTSLRKKLLIFLFKIKRIENQSKNKTFNNVSQRNKSISKNLRQFFFFRKKSILHRSINKKNESFRFELLKANAKTAIIFFSTYKLLTVL